MSGINDIKLIDLALGFSILIVPIFFFLYYRISLIKDMFISITRMAIQLALVAIYLEWIFVKNSALINIAWVLIMVFVGVITSIGRLKVKRKYFFVPFLLAGLSTILIIDTFFLGYVLKLDYFFDARYFIPITGLILGSSMNHNIVGLSTYLGSLSSKSDLYYFLLTNSGDKKLALRPYVSKALIKALNPMIANISVMGLISLPGMMTGQILGGSSPAIAIKYQIMIMLAIFVGCTINLNLSIIFSNLFIFDKFGSIKRGIMKKK